MSDATARRAQRALAESGIATARARSPSGDHEQVERRVTDALASLGGPTRRGRQLAEILSTVFEGRLARALGLAFQHLQEFHADDWLVDVLEKAVPEQRDAGLSAELEILRARFMRRC
jgi:hypothetical protein